MGDNPLVGAWRLVSWEDRGEDGEVSHPYGRDPVGYIMYTPDGYMSVIITTANRPTFQVDDILVGSVEERAAAAATCVSYCGSYEVRDGKVIHHVEASLFPNWVGTAQERFYTFEGDRLTLSTGPMLMGGSERRAYLTWERASARRGW